MTKEQLAKLQQPRVIFRVVACKKGERDSDGRRVKWKIDKPCGWDGIPQQARLLSLGIYLFDDAPVLSDRKELPGAWPLYYSRKDDAIRVGRSLAINCWQIGKTPAQAIIHNRDGRIGQRGEFSYGCNRIEGVI